MTDKELLELAARANGMYKESFSLDDDYQPIYEDELGFCLALGYGWWNPLIDDGDAFLLAVKLSLTVDIGIDKYTTCEWLEMDDCIEEWFNGDKYAATRRAIVRAAAEIGKNLTKND